MLQNNDIRLSLLGEKGPAVKDGSNNADDVRIPLISLYLLAIPGEAGTC